MQWVILKYTLETKGTLKKLGTYIIWVNTYQLDDVHPVLNSLNKPRILHRSFRYLSEDVKIKSGSE